MGLKNRKGIRKSSNSGDPTEESDLLLLLQNWYEWMRKEEFPIQRKSRKNTAEIKKSHIETLSSCIIIKLHYNHINLENAISGESIAIVNLVRISAFKGEVCCHIIKISNETKINT